MAILETILSSQDYDTSAEFSALEEKNSDQWLCEIGVNLARLSDDIEYEYGFRLPVMVLAKLTVNDLNTIRSLNCARVRSEI